METKAKKIKKWIILELVGREDDSNEFLVIFGCVFENNIIWRLHKLQNIRGQKNLENTKVVWNWVCRSYWIFFSN